MLKEKYVALNKEKNYIDGPCFVKLVDLKGGSFVELDDIFVEGNSFC